MENILSIAKTLQESVKCQNLYIEDLGGCGCGQKVAVYIVSDRFVGMTVVKRHQLIMGVLKEEIAKIHAVTLKNMTPEEWEKKKEDLLTPALGEDRAIKSE